MITSFVIINIFRFYVYDRKINKLEKELEVKIIEIHQEIFENRSIEEKVKLLQREYEIQIKELKKKRDYILDKTPVKKIIRKYKK